MSQKIKQRERQLKHKEERLKKALDQDGNILREKASRIGKIALIAGMISLFLYWIYNSFVDSEGEQEQVKSKRSSSPSFTQRIGKLITPYITKLLAELLEVEEKKEEQTKED